MALPFIHNFALMPESAMARSKYADTLNLRKKEQTGKKKPRSGGCPKKPEARKRSPFAYG